mmetsp:Transcript_17342/g.49285  ORF Transcript_17342/g.49285 Transcript_17342/m.49285 type:complete len:164 (-) Transcript_17342:255-746(-)
MSAFSKTIVASALLALAWNAVADEAVTNAEVDQALADDEVCGSYGDEAAICALNALQAKALKVDAENDGEAQGACDSGLVGQIKSFAPDCINACPQSCGALGQAINAYLTKGGQPAAKRVICQHKGEFSCAFDHWGACQKLADKAGGMGFKLPRSKGELYGGC